MGPSFRITGHPAHVAVLLPGQPAIEVFLPQVGADRRHAHGIESESLCPGHELGPCLIWLENLHRETL